MITENEILEKYPILFKQKDLPMAETCMCWGLGVPDSWLPVIDDLCYCLVNYGYRGGSEFGVYNKPTVIADQVKEKFGGLRFYYHLEFDDESSETNKKSNGQISREYQKYYDGMIAYAEYQISKLNK